MSRCDTCGNEYDQAFEVQKDGHAYAFDCFECAIHKLAPVCPSCGCRIIGHGVQSGEEILCSAHCARTHGIGGISTHVGSRPAKHPPVS